MFFRIHLSPFFLITKYKPSQYKDIEIMTNTSSNQTQRISYPMLDLLKFFFCFMVVAIHVDFFRSREEQPLFNYLQTASVPFFFAVSGFLLNQKMLSGRQVLKRARRYLFLYLIWTLIYLPLSISIILNSDASLLSSLSDYLRRILFYGEYQLSWALWYLHSLVISMLIIAWMRSHRWPDYSIFLVGLLLYYSIRWLNESAVAGTLPYGLQQPVAWLYKIFIGFRSLQGLVYVSIGMLIARYQHLLARIRISHLSSINGQVFLSLLLIGGSLFDTPIRKLLMAAGITLMGVCCSSVRNNRHNLLLRQLSTLVYLLHLLIIATLQSFSFCSDSYQSFYISVCILSIGASLLILYLSDKPLGRWLKHLY